MSHYDCQKLPETLIVSSAQVFRERTGLCENDADETVARAMVSSGESGWDMNPRMAEKTYQFAPADLNSLLYAMEDNLRFFAMELGKEKEAEEWYILREKRAELCRKYLKNKDGLFMDYNYIDDKQTNIFSAACFYPLYCGMATAEEAESARSELHRIETDYGIVTCEKIGVDLKGWRTT